jgi:3-deoxy-D-manno-octulosonate 8-phosphate phosphatase (KDO 8-P phosphatase)
MAKTKEQTDKLARKVKLLILDVDGVLTDNGLYLDDRGIESKRFNVIDGVGIRLAQRAGIEVALISGRPSRATKIRAAQLNIKHVSLGQTDKIKAYQRLKRSLRLKDDQMAYMGDDLLDVPVLKRAGFPICVKNANPKVKRFAKMVTKTRGGDGAVREVVDMILKAKGENPLELAL